MLKNWFEKLKIKPVAHGVWIARTEFTVFSFQSIDTQKRVYWVNCAGLLIYLHK